MVAKKKVTARVPKRTVKYRAKKRLPAELGGEQVQAGDEVSKKDADKIAKTLGVAVEELFEKV
jgi:hypothetical protein